MRLFPRSFATAPFASLLAVTLLAVTPLAVVPLAVAAQGASSAAVATIPQYVSIKIGTGAAAKTVSQLTVPFMFVVPISSRFNIDVATAYAASEVRVNGASASKITGLTDTQVRANLTLGTDAVVLTVGANLPTGQYRIDEQTEADAAGQIGNDFLLFPTSSYGAGLSTTGGIAVAHTLGNWNVGLAGSFRKSTQFDAFQAASDTGRMTLTFTPADEMRARLGADRTVGNGRLTVGVTYSTFGNDMLANTSYATGNRYIGQASLYLPVGSSDLYLSGWGLYRAKGQQFGGVSNPETVMNGSVSIGFRAGGLVIEPSIEGRNWQVDGVKAGLLANGGLRLRWSAGPLTFMPSGTYQVGKLYSTSDGSSTDVSGWRMAMMLRVH